MKARSRKLYLETDPKVDCMIKVVSYQCEKGGLVNKY